MENMKTVREIAKEIGVSKQAIHKKRKKEPLSSSLQSLTTTVDGVVYISVDGVELLKKAFSSDFTVNQLTSVDDNELMGVDGVIKNENDKIISILEQENEFLKEQLKVKDEQLKEKDNQLNTKDEIIKREQELRLIAEKTNLLLSSAEPGQEDKDAVDEKNQKVWWKFWN